MGKLASRRHTHSIQVSILVSHIHILHRVRGCFLILTQIRSDQAPSDEYKISSRQ